MKRNLISLIIIGILFSMSLETYAQDDLSVLNIQGVIRDEKGGAVEDGDYQFTFKIYDSEDGTVELWSEINTLTVTSGVYSANLGETTTFASAGLGFDKPYYVGVQFESEAEASPRIRLTAAPYALALQGGDNVFPSSGNVGVNTSSPESQLHVVGDAKVEDGDVSIDGNVSLDRADNSTVQSINFNTGSTQAYSIEQSAGLDNLYIKSQGTSAMSIKDASEVRVRTTDFVVDGTATLKSSADVAGTVNANNLTIDGKAPFVHKSYTLDDGSEVSLATGVSSVDYYALLMGVRRGTGDIHENGSTELWSAYIYDIDNQWTIVMKGAANSDLNRVYVLYIKRELVSSSF